MVKAAESSAFLVRVRLRVRARVRVRVRVRVGVRLRLRLRVMVGGGEADDADHRLRRLDEAQRARHLVRVGLG